jgi:hypothetical protein
MTQGRGDVSILRRNRKSHPRKIGVFDEMVLIAAFGVAIVVTRSMLADELRLFHTRPTEQTWIMELLDWVPVAYLGLMPRYVAIAMPALLLIRLRRPRSSLRRLSRQPGAVACAAGTAAIFTGGLIALAGTIGGGWYLIPSEPRAWPIVEARVPMAVVTAWIILWLSGRWRSEPSWMDRSGRALGGFWISLWLSRWYLLLHG